MAPPPAERKTLDSPKGMWCGDSTCSLRLHFPEGVRMAAKTPVTDPSATGYVDPHRGVVTGSVGVADSLLLNGSGVANAEGMKFQRFTFTDIDDGDTWASGIPQIRAVAWQPNLANTHKVGVVCTDVVTGTVTFEAQNANSVGWLWVLSGGSGS